VSNKKPLFNYVWILPIFPTFNHHPERGLQDQRRLGTKLVLGNNTQLGLQKAKGAPINAGIAQQSIGTIQLHTSTPTTTPISQTHFTNLRSNHTICKA
jgi:hypothetical protein